MKNLLFLLVLSCAQFIIGQATTNQSIGTISTNITNPTAAQSGEIFRFRAGSVRQLDAGTSFNFTNSRWFSLGRVATGTQTVYGLRLQLPNKSVNFGYQDINSPNPRIQWIGTGGNLGDLEFRVANSFTSTNSTLVARMTKDGNTIFGNPTNLFGTNPLNAKVDIESTGELGLKISVPNNSSVFNSTGFEVQMEDNQPFNFSTGGKIRMQSSGNATGLNISLNAAVDAFGIISSVSSSPGFSFGVYGGVGSSTGNDNFAIYGTSSTANSNSFAGFFEGNVSISGSIFNPSDKKLKENVTEEMGALDRIALLKPITYNYKEMSELNLPTQKQHGFISQDFAKVFPELTQDITKPIFDENGKITSKYSYKGINYIGLISVLTEAVNELNGEVQLLKKEITILKHGQVSEERINSSTNDNLSSVKLEQNIPNPFSDQTSIRYQLDENANDASLIVFDLNGNIKKEFKLSSNSGEITINASLIGRGMFLYSLVQNGQELVTKKMIIK